MYSLNKIMLIGYLGADPELRYTSNNTAMVKFRMATTERYKDSGGEQRERTAWHNIVVWAKLAEFCNESLKKGSRVYVEGSLRVREWETNQGEKRKAYEVSAQNIILLDRPTRVDNNSNKFDQGSNSSNSRNITDINNIDEEEDDLPF